MSRRACKIPAESRSLLTTSTSTRARQPTRPLPPVLGVAPTNNQQNVGLNGLAEVTFSKPINPLTVNSTTVSLSYGSTPTQIPTTVTFDTTYTYVTFTPVEPLPASTTMKLTIGGVQDVAGNTVTTQSTTFVTGATADTIAPHRSFLFTCEWGNERTNQRLGGAAVQ